MTDLPRVIGLDLSLAATGLAELADDNALVTKTIRSVPAGEGVYASHARLRGILAQVWEHVTQGGPYPALVVLEGPSYNSRGTGTWDRAGLWWLVVDTLTCTLGCPRIPVAVVPPAVLKKYATGRGTADKTAMAVALAKRAGGLELRDDNRVDAFWLAAAGRDRLGHPFLKLPQAQRDVLAKADWPEVG